MSSISGLQASDAGPKDGSLPAEGSARARKVVRGSKEAVLEARFHKPKRLGGLCETSLRGLHPNSTQREVEDGK